MIKKCKWCKNKVEMRGKKVFCSEKCKQAYKYAKNTGKIEKKNSVNDSKDNIPDDQYKFPNLIGQLTKVTTTVDQCVRITVDIPVENVNFDVIQYFNQNVVIAFIGENEKEGIKKETKQEGKDKFFND
jgi:hypothetical protein